MIKKIRWKTAAANAACFAVNSICCMLYIREARAFASVKDIAAEQKKKLFQILKKNKYSEFGKQYDFGSIDSIASYQEKIPLYDYEAYAGYIDRIAEGGKNILTEEEVLLFEPTSGSATASKLIPYTRGLKEEFQKGLKPWVYDLYTNNKGIKWGRSYWSVTPAAYRQKYTDGGIPIGFEEDSEYFGSFGRFLLDFIFAIPSKALKACDTNDMDAFYYQTALHLLKCRNLTLISVWNPSLLLILLDYMHKNSETLIKDISAQDEQRGAELVSALSEREFHRLWRQLKVISCWCDASAEGPARRLKDMFPGAVVQPKGLLSTEGFISFPLGDEEGARLSVKSHFFEFISMSDGKIYLAHELKTDEKYSVVITTSGGLYRYRLKDIVEVIGFNGCFPLLRFRGREDKVSDLFGEKLNEAFVKSIFDKMGIHPDFCMIAPEKDHYVAFFPAEYLDSDSTPVAEELCTVLDEALRQGFHYDYCRKLGQLQKLRIFRLTGDPAKEYLEECVRRGQRLGDIKPVLLHTHDSWDKAFRGGYI